MVIGRHRAAALAQRKRDHQREQAIQNSGRGHA
jgi:hypothetical protein